MKIIGINISHDPSVCIFYENKITGLFFEERFNLKKKFVINNEDFFLSIFKKIDFKPDLVVYASYERNDENSVTDKKIIKKIQNQLDNPPYYFNKKNHHVYHACSSFYFSKFTEAMAIVIDGGGSKPQGKNYQEIQSIFYMNKNKILKLFQFLSNIRSIRLPTSFNNLKNNYSDFMTQEFIDGTEYLFSSAVVGGYNFIVACDLINMTEEPGKLMGLSSYAYTGKKYDLNYQHVEIAKYVQEKSFFETCELIEKAYNYKKIKNFVLSGGYFLNCSNNFKYVKKYPEFNFFVDPNPTDGGTSIGACVYYDSYR